MAKRRKPKNQPWWREHSLALVSAAILLAWVLLYTRSSEETHAGSFFGNAIADWTGLLMMVVGTKFLYEKGSAESKQPHPLLRNRFGEFLREHSLSVFLVLTGVGWLVLFLRMDAQGKWGQVVANVVSEWTQLLGLVLMTKALIEKGSKDSK